MLWSLALVFLGGLLAGEVFRRLRLPPLLGMLLVGIAFGPYALGLLDDSLLAISADLRKVALIIILTRAGLSLDIGDLRKVGRSAVLLCFVPATFETVCLLSKLNAKQHIEINLDMDELDLTDAEKKATYQEIKDYVLEHSGLKVSSLYIAQVKQQCGIIERENYNKPKSEDAKQPQCPPDKEKAIKEALKHFGMI